MDSAVASLVKALVLLPHGHQIEGHSVKGEEDDDGLHGEHPVDRRIEEERGRCEEGKDDERILRGHDISPRNAAYHVAGGKARKDEQDLDHGKLAE